MKALKYKLNTGLELSVHVQECSGKGNELLKRDVEYMYKYGGKVFLKFNEIIIYAERVA